MKLALVHDLAESIVGDIAPADNISKAEKHRREKVHIYLSLFTLRMMFNLELHFPLYHGLHHSLSGSDGSDHRPVN